MKKAKKKANHQVIIIKGLPPIQVKKIMLKIKIK
jgi:hypothetical protein